MSDDHDAWLADAVEAAREVAHDDAPASIEGAATRSRIHATLERRRGTNKKRFTLIAAVVASMFGSTAFAYYSGIGPFKRKAEPEPAPAAIATSEPVPAAKPPRRAPVTPAVEVVPPAPEPVPEVVAPPPAPAVVAPAPAPLAEPAPKPKQRVAPAAPEPAPEVVAPAPAPEPAPPPPPPPAPAPDAELLAYQQAHDAHFKGSSPLAALAAWDSYLAQFPDGKLAPEARYDRALVLVKLERWSEARAALMPFANAPAGAYRQREAAKILDAIKDR